MRYEASLIQMTETLQKTDARYALICLSAVGLQLSLNGIRCFLDGKYLLCLSADDTLQIKKGYYEALQLRFMPYFYNVNLNHRVIGMPMYEEMRASHGYPDFHLFRDRDDSYIGILPLEDNGYRLIMDHLRRAEMYIAGHATDHMWSCRTRSEMIAILRIAEGAGLPEEEGTDVIRYIQENIAEDHTLDSLCTRFHTNRTTLARWIKDRTGMTPMQYIREERLRQSLPDLLFTFLPINEVAEKYGFTDANYYIRLFRKRYGKTPQLYRTEGFDSRIQGEEFFHKREHDVLSRSAFDRYLRGGCGQAVRILQNAEDCSIFREAFIAHFEDENQMLTGYEKELLDCFEDAETLRETIVPKLLARLNAGEHFHSIPFLLLLGEEKRVEEITERLYREAHEKLLAWMRLPESARKRDSDPECAVMYMAVASAIGGWRQPGEERIRQILWDIADFYTYMEHPPIPEQRNPLFSIWNGMGKENLFRLLDDLALTHPHGEKLHLQLAVKEPPVPTAIYTPEEILASEISYEDYESKRLSFASAPKEVHCTAAEQILTEEEPQRREYLTQLFVPSKIGTPSFYPLSPEPLIEKAKACARLQKDNPYQERCTDGADLYRLLASIRHPAVRAYGEQLMAENDEDSSSFFYGFWMVYGGNYAPEDKEDFGGYLYRKERKIWETAFSIFCGQLTGGRKTEELPMHLLSWLWEECCDRIEARTRLVDALNQSGCLPDDIREDCRYDKCRHIRMLVGVEE